MTIKQTIKLVADTRHYSKEEMLKVTDRLPFFDAINYLIWVNKLLNIELSL